jgi:hypothetical protein
MTPEPRPYGRQPVALKSLAGDIAFRLTRELREVKALDHSVHVKAYWLREELSGYGSPDYRYAYVWIAPIWMSFALCEQIEHIVKSYDRVLRTGRGGGDPSREINPLRPFVYAVVAA